jgi:hypothetical protein
MSTQVAFGYAFLTVRHPQHIVQSRAHLVHLLTPLPRVLPGFHPLASLLIFLCLFPYPCLVKKMKYTRGTRFGILESTRLSSKRYIIYINPCIKAYRYSRLFCHHLFEITMQLFP